MPRNDTPKVSVAAVKLTNATCDCVPWPHELYAGLPTKKDIDKHRDKGLMPCLAVGTPTNGVQTWQGMIVALPKYANCEPVNIPEISAALAIIKSIQSVDIRGMNGLAFIDELYNSSYRHPPFAHFGAEAERALDRAVTDLRNAGITDRLVFDQLDKTCKNLIDQQTKDVPWSPVVLISNVKVLEKHVVNWALLRHWRGWLQETKEIGVLHNKFRKLVATLDANEGPKRGKGPPGKEHMLLNAFLNRLRHLKIPCAQEFLDPEAYENDRRRREGVRLKSEKRRREYAEAKAKLAIDDSSEGAEPKNTGGPLRPCQGNVQ